MYGTGVLFEEPNPTGSRPSDLIGLDRERRVEAMMMRFMEVGPPIP